MTLIHLIQFIHFIFSVIYTLYLKHKMGNNKSVDVYVFKYHKFEKVKPAKRRKQPLPRSGHRIVCDEKNLYSFGGYNPLTTGSEDEAIEEDEFNSNSYPLFKELWKFNFATRKWKRYNRRQYLPIELASNAVIREGNYLMVYGGTGAPFGYRCSNQFYICPLNEKQGHMLQIETSGEQPPPQYGQALVYHNKYLYTIGGTTGFTYTCNIHRLNINSRVWENVFISQGQTDYEPSGRYRHEVAFDGKNIYILGGGTAEEAFDFFTLPVFNIETRRWQQVKTKKDQKCITSNYYNSGIPAARRCHGAVQINTENDIHVFITGGFDGEVTFNDLWKLELSSLQWNYIEKCFMPKPLYFHSTAVTPEGKMYVFGGIYADEDLKRSNEIYSVWLCIPKLSEMCWEAILHYTPLIVSCQQKLFDIGLPKRFVDRLE